MPIFNAPDGDGQQSEMRLKPKNWAIFQHYKDRCPPWIKLHRELLNDRKFMTLPTASKALAPLLWLIASESRDGTFSAEVAELSFRTRMSEGEVGPALKHLIEAGFFLDASTMLAPSLQSARPERETETETEGEQRKKKAPKGVEKPDAVSDQTWTDFLAHRKRVRADLTSTALAGIMREADKAGWTLENALTECVIRGWRGFKADWVKEKENGNNYRGGSSDRRSSLARAIDDGLEFLG